MLARVLQLAVSQKGVAVATPVDLPEYDGGEKMTLPASDKSGEATGIKLKKGKSGRPKKAKN